MEDLLTASASDVLEFALHRHIPLPREIEADPGVRILSRCLAVLGLAYSHWSVDWTLWPVFNSLSDGPDSGAFIPTYRRTLNALVHRVNVLEHGSKDTSNIGHFLKRHSSLRVLVHPDAAMSAAGSEGSDASRSDDGFTRPEFPTEQRVALAAAAAADIAAQPDSDDDELRLYVDYDVLDEPPAWIDQCEELGAPVF